MAEEPYEIVPHKEIADLKKQIKELKAKGSDSDSKQLVGSVNKLTEHIHSMMSLFKSAADDMHLEEKDEHFVAKKIEPLIGKLDEIIEQNKTIAEGIVAVADTLKENMEKHPVMPQTKPEQEFGPNFEMPPAEMPELNEMHPRTRPMPPPFMPKHTPPRPMPSMPMPAMPKPFPFDKPKKKGLFGRFK
jgi:chromosome segregation ATPase